MAIGEVGVKILRELLPTTGRRAGRVASESGTKMARDVARFESQALQAAGKRDAVAIVARLDAELRRLNPEALAIKYENMAKSPRRFLTGQPALMAHDLRALPERQGAHTVLHGDMHLHNFGTVVKPSGKLKVRPIDFDEATIGPASFDLDRLATHVVLTGREQELGARKTRSLVERLGGDYWDALAAIARGEKPGGKTPGPIAELLEGAEKRDAAAWIDRRAPRSGGVRRLEREAGRTDVGPAQLASLKSALAGYQQGLPELRGYRVTDAVAVMSGTGSIGRPRFRVLLEGARGQEPVILQLKAQEAAALERVAPAGRRFASPAKRGLAIGDVLDGGLDPYRGVAKAPSGPEFLVERLRASDATLRVDELTDPKDFEKVVGFYGREVARGHAHGADVGLAGAKEILASLGEREAFVGSLVDFSHAYADQTTKDHAAFVKAIAQDRLLTRAAR